MYMVLLETAMAATIHWQYFKSNFKSIFLGKTFIFDTKNNSMLMNITVQTTSAVTAGHCIYCSFRRQKFVRGKLSSSHSSTSSHSNRYIGYCGSGSWCERKVCKKQQSKHSTPNHQVSTWISLFI